MDYLPHKNDNNKCDCYIKSKELFPKKIRDNMINDCFPLYDMKQSGINILDFSQSDYIHYNQKNIETYYLTKDFNLIKYGGEFKYEQINYLQKIKDNIHYYLNLSENNTPPVFYMFCNKNNIVFDIFLHFAVDIHPRINTWDSNRI